ncbi:30S ribosomal protein S15 [Thermoplasmatales archaeon SW_10_69_26]|jgi:small subunit ribosomal protein S15|nr:MAG: 30S ribosomal protein S15 [Thermoplasmatales archaeon SW_10_69_26]
MAPDDDARARKAAHEDPDWSRLTGKEVEELVVDLADEGKQSSEIGTILRDQYAVPDVKAATGKKITAIMEENDVDPPVPEDLRNLLARAVNLREHLKENPNDLHNRRGLQQIESKIRKLAKYYKEEGELDREWAYSERTAKMVVE